MTKQKLVLAGSFQQFRIWLRKNGFTEKDARYINRPEQLLGWRATDAELIRTGTWTQNPCVGSRELEIFHTKRTLT